MRALRRSAKENTDDICELKPQRVISYPNRGRILFATVNNITKPVVKKQKVDKRNKRKPIKKKNKFTKDERKLLQRQKK